MSMPEALTCSEHSHASKKRTCRVARARGGKDAPKKGTHLPLSETSHDMALGDAAGCTLAHTLRALYSSDTSSSSCVLSRTRVAVPRSGSHSLHNAVSQAQEWVANFRGLQECFNGRQCTNAWH